MRTRMHAVTRPAGPVRLVQSAQVLSSMYERIHATPGPIVPDQPLHACTSRMYPSLFFEPVINS